MITFNVPCHYTVRFSTIQQSNNSQNVYITSSFNAKSVEITQSRKSRRTVLISTVLFPITFFTSSAPSHGLVTEFYDLPHSGGVKALDLRLGDGTTPVDGDQVAIHYYGRLAAKQGWRFDSTYDHKDSTGESIPFTFILGSNNSFFDRQRLFTTIFNPTRLANGEGSTLRTLIFDIELVNVKH
ncbi:peptidyl-prolyl cis-trans isomerase FKBP17-1, chloroplastic isoform X2 [Silene latifolia]|uniref:peptidyl-prolyl cis-trans isomerase FKBP17-1, chloroplastic isoform X2 n=1 Tax=Silene latifolia TaxID=37657 RepID=UPI003D78135E